MKSSAVGKKRPWIQAVTDARKALKITGFQAVKKGTPLYAKAKALYKPKADIELLTAEASPNYEDEEQEDQDDDEQQEQEQDEQDEESEDDVELLAANAAPEDEEEEEQEQEEQDDDEEQEDDDESQDDVELLAAKSKGKVAKAAKVAKKAVKKAEKAKKKAKKAVKKPKKKKKKVSKVAKGRYRKVLVLRGKKEKTVGGLKATDLIKNKYGRVVSKKTSARAKKSPWIKAVADARSALKLKGFVLVKKGTPLYAKAKSLYKPKSDIELLEEGAGEEEQEDEQEQVEQDEQQDDIELLTAEAAPEDEDEEEQE